MPMTYNECHPLCFKATIFTEFSNLKITCYFNECHVGVPISNWQSLTNFQKSLSYFDASWLPSIFPAESQVSQTWSLFSVFIDLITFLSFHDNHNVQGPSIHWMLFLFSWQNRINFSTSWQLKVNCTLVWFSNCSAWSNNAIKPFR